MSLALFPISTKQFPAWMKRSAAEYLADLVATGVPEHKAQADASGTMERAFPDGLPSPTNAVFILMDSALGNVGYIWIGCDSSGDPDSWWVWDIVVEAEHRGKGFGRQAMILAEGYARAHGGQTLGLNVFGFNNTARRLYESLGYETISIKMRKTL